MTEHDTALHPIDAHAQWTERTLVARTMLLAIQELHDEHGEGWTDHISFHGTPTELLLRIAEELDGAGYAVTRDVAAWWDCAHFLAAVPLTGALNDAMARPGRA